MPTATRASPTAPASSLDSPSRRASSIERSFTGIYQTHAWGKFGGGSGSGSALANARGAINILFHVIMHFNISSMIDAPCGAMEWQTSLLSQLVYNQPGFRFLGVDVVRSVVERNQQSFSGNWLARLGTSANARQWNPGFSVDFAQADLASEGWSVPSGYELILSRDALQHNKLADVWRILRRYAESDARYVLIGSYPDGSRHCGAPTRGEGGHTGPNRDLPRTGAFFCIDLRQRPFNLTPIRVFREGTDDRKALYLFERAKLREELASRGLSTI